MSSFVNRGTVTLGSIVFEARAGKSALIRNVVFDVGNVFVRWSPGTIVDRTFGEPFGGDANKRRTTEIFGSSTWLALNRGELSFDEAADEYRAQLGLTLQQCTDLFHHITDSQTPVDGTEALAVSLKQAGYRVFGLTDNVREIVSHLRRRYAFWNLFEGVVVSAEIGILKPNPVIFQHLLDRFGLSATETVFLDDMQRNVDGARAAGIAAIVFSDASKCSSDLRELGLSY